MAGEPTERAALVAAWCELDRNAGVLPADREIVDASRSMRTVIADFASAGGTDEEIYDTCALLGRFIAVHGGSPTLASRTIDHAGIVFDAVDAAWVVPARAAVAEGFTYALLEKVQHEALRSWEFPRCAVGLPDEAIAIAAGYPSDDPEELREWAARVAKAAALQGIRRAHVAGPDAARDAVLDALDLVGIAVAGPLRR